MASAAVDVLQVSVRFPGRSAPALDRLDLHVAPGEKVAVLGPSGCGKTTLLRCVLGAVPFSGRVRVGEDDPAEPRARLRIRHQAGVVRQGSDLVPQLSGGLNALMGVTHTFGPLDWVRIALGTVPPEWQEPLSALAERHGVCHCLRTPAGLLSGGEKHRVALVRALLGGPSLVLADEPTTGLDPVASARVVDHLLDTDGVTLVATTHDLAVARRFPRVVGVREGRVVRDTSSLDADDATAIYGPG